MFDIGFTEFLLVAIVALLVLGPDRLPHALRTLGLWSGRMRRSFNAVREEIESEIGMDEIRRQLRNEGVMEELRKMERDIRSTVNKAAGTSLTSLARARDPDRTPGIRVAAAAADSTTAAGTVPATAAGGEPPRIEARQDG